MDEDGDPADVLVAAQRRDDLEAVDPGQNQIENHEVGLVSERLLDPGASAVDRADANVEGFENSLDQADRLKVVIDHQDIGGHLFRALGIGHEIESHHQLDELLPVDRFAQDLAIREGDWWTIGGYQYHERDVTRARILAELLDQGRRATERQLGVDQHRQRLQVGRLLQGAGTVVDVDDLVAGALEERLDPLPRDHVVVRHQNVWRSAPAVDHRWGVGIRCAAAGQRAYRLAERQRAVMQVLQVFAMLLDRERVCALVEQDAGKSDQRVEARVD